jgi:hypothetical protein
MKVQIVTPYCVSHSQRYSITVNNTALRSSLVETLHTSKAPPVPTIFFTYVQGVSQKS